MGRQKSVSVGMELPLSIFKNTFSVFFIFFILQKDPLNFLSIRIYKNQAIVAVVVERLACWPVTQKIGVHFYLERESSAISSWTNEGREWCCRGWAVEGGTSGGLFRTRDGLPRTRKVWATHNVHECENACAWNKMCEEMAAMCECLYVCCISLYMYMWMFTVFKLMCVFHCTAL